MSEEPFAYGIQAPIGSVTPLFHKLKDAEDYIAKLTDSRDEAKIIPLYRASTTIETMLECWHRVIVRNEELDAEIARLRLTDKERKAIKTVIGGFGMWVAENGLTDNESLRLAVVTIRALLERLK